MVVRRLYPRISRHLIGMPFTNFTLLTSTLFGVEEGIARGFWQDSSPKDPKGKEPLAGQSPDVYTVSSSRQRVTRCRRAAPRSTEAYSPYPRHYHTVSSITTICSDSLASSRCLYRFFFKTEGH